MTDRPKIPMALSHRPTVGGLVVPWVNVQIADGTADFRSQHRTRVDRCWTERRCQVCGAGIDATLVLLGGPNQVRDLLFDEPPLHPACSSYTADACPMVNGTLTTYPARPRVAEGHRGGTCPDPNCDCGGWVPDGDSEDHGGDPAHEWYAVWTRRFAVAIKPDGSIFGGKVEPADVAAVRLLSRPSEGRALMIEMLRDAPVIPTDPSRAL